MKKLLLLILLAGCGPVGDPRLGGAALECDGECGIDITDDRNVERIGMIINAACDYWKEDPGCLDGWRIILSERILDHCITMEGQFGGCANALLRTIRVWTGNGFCIEKSALFHEVGHAHYFMGDPGHWAKAWWDHQRLADYYFMVVQNAMNLMDEWICPPCYLGMWSGDADGPHICPETPLKPPSGR